MMMGPTIEFTIKKYHSFDPAISTLIEAYNEVSLHRITLFERLVKMTESR